MAWLWDAATGEERHRLDVAASLSAAAFSPDGSHVAAATAGERNSLALVEVKSGRVVRDSAVGLPPVGLAFTPDGAQVWFGGAKGGVGDWDAAAGKELAAQEPDEGVTVWDAETGGRLRTLKDMRTARLVGWGPDGRGLIANGADGVRVWDAETGQPMDTPLPLIRPHTIALSPDGRRLLTAAEYEPVRLWELPP
jgi:WD40 repeat protein